VRRTATLVLLATLFGCGDHSTHRPQPNLIEAASWSHPDAGYRLHVRPTLAGRLSTATRTGTALTESLRESGPAPLVLSPAQRNSLVNQLRWHAAFAPHKPVWNLETWRPDVGYGRTVLHLCNP